MERAYQAISDKLCHAVGSQKSQGCERCLRLINARVLYHVRHHQELFTEGAHKLVWMELEQRNKEHREEGKKGYRSDGLFFRFNSKKVAYFWMVTGDGFIA